MTDKKKKELIEGCPWRHFDVYGEPVCKAVLTTCSTVEYPCTAPDCGPMYFYFARGEIWVSSGKWYFEVVGEKKTGEGWGSVLWSDLSVGEKAWRVKAFSELFIMQSEAEARKVSELLSPHRKDKGEGDPPTTEPERTVPAQSCKFCKETATAKYTLIQGSCMFLCDQHRINMIESL